jgi:hypothetical protein
VGKTPQNQLDALPLLDADTAAAGGELNITGSSLTRFWSAAVLGLGSNFALVGGVGIMVSNLLDVRGCSAFSLIINRSFVAGGDVSHDVDLYILWATVSGVAESMADAGSLTDHTRMMRWSYLIGDATPFVLGRGWDRSTLSAISQVTGAMVGTRVRIVLRSSIAPNANQTYAVELWGAQ